MDWNHIVNWSLKSGSHEFPGPDGGTCINEAAIVAAGFEYRMVGSADDCPPCFSRPIAAFAIMLNDTMPHGLRQELLMPFLMRLAGTADTPEVERRRYEFILFGLLREVIPVTLRGWMDDHADKFAAANTLEEGRDAARALDLALARHLDRDLAHDRVGDLALARALDLAAGIADFMDACPSALRAIARARPLARALDLALDLARARNLARASASSRELFTAAVVVLDGALRIGKQPEPLDTALICERMDAARNRRRVKCASSR